MVTGKLDLGRKGYREDDCLNLAASVEEYEKCDDFQASQRLACDCVPAGELDARLNTRLEDFFRDYDPSMLNKKGKLKDKKRWKAWKGKKPELFFDLFLRYNKSIEISSKSETVEHTPSEEL